MESYLHEHFCGMKAKDSPEEALRRRWNLCTVVKLRFLFTVNLSKRSKAEGMKKINQEKLPFVVLVSNLAQFYLGNAFRNEYVVPEENMDANLVGVTTKRHRMDVGPSSASLVSPSRNPQPDELANIQVFEENKPSVVSINVAGRFGSGFIWDTEGHIVTNYHVIRGASYVSVTLADKMKYKANIVGSNLDNDVAVLRIDAPKEKLRPIKVGRSSNLRIGQKVYAIGHPFGWRYAFTQGIISLLGAYFYSPANLKLIQDGILTTAPINPGNSGGPLLDSSGYLIGMNTDIYSQIREFNGVGFAVPVDTVKGIVEQKVKFGKVRRPISGDSGSSARRSQRVCFCGARTKPR